LNLFKKDVESADNDDIIYPSAIPFILIHLGRIAAMWTGIICNALAIT
jgi:stearoyl-CoA desaturase (delta-9 desaturase)